MALLMFEGFDHMSGGTGLTSKWATSPGTISSAAARTGGFGLQMSTTGITRTFPAVGGFVVGAAFRCPTAGGWGSQDLLRLREGTTDHLVLSSNGAEKLCVKRGSTVIATGTTTLVINNWYYFEFKGTIDPTVGAFEVRIDQVQEAALTMTGQNTRNGGTTGQWDRLACTSNNSHNMDDLYICDQSGTDSNDFLGSVKVETMIAVPDGQGMGFHREFTPSSGTDHGAMVDENPPNTSDYNSSSVVGAKETYRFPAPVLTGTPLGIQTVLYVAKSDTGPRTACPLIRSGGSDFDGPSSSLTTTFGYIMKTYAKNPITGLPWTAAEIAALEVGLKVVS